MSLVALVLLVVLGALCGLAAQLLIGVRAGGFFISAVLGILGALVGTWLARAIGLPSVVPVTIEGYTLEPLWAVLGAVLLLSLLVLLRRPRRPLV